MRDLTVIIPAKDEDVGTLERIRRELTRLGAQTVLVDDCSQEPHPKAIKHGRNFGYGASILTGLRYATRPLVLTMDGDGQHTVEAAIKLYKAYKLSGTDMVVGIRSSYREPFCRKFFRTCLNILASVIAGRWLVDLNSGIRILRTEVLRGYSRVLCPTFSFTTSLTMSLVLDGYQVNYFPVKVEDRKTGTSKVKFKHGVITLWYIVKIGFALRTRNLRSLWRKLIKK